MKKKFLALTMASAVMLMGAGYAWWSDSTTVVGSVDTGKVDVNIQWATVSTPDHTTADPVVIDQNTNTITFGVNDIYPTVYNTNDNQTYSKIHFAIKNEGTVPVKLGDIEFTPTNPDSPVWNYLRTRIHIFAGTPSATGTSLTTEANLMGSPNALEGNLKDLRTILLADARNSNYEVLKNYVLDPGKAIWFGGNTDEESSIRFFLDPNTPDVIDGQSLEDQEVGFTLKFNWEQFNK